MTSPRTQRIGREAAEWVVIFDGVEFNAHDVRAFRRWLAKSEDHRAAFELASRTWNQLDLLARLEAFDLRANDAAPGVSRRALVLGLGAGALTVGAGSYVALSGSPAEAFETGVGEQRAILLSDGTQVVLNARSRVEARIDSHRRQVRLVTGEALFAVADRSQLPFSITLASVVVSAANGQILAKLLPNGARVALISARADISRRSWMGNTDAIIAPAGSEVDLTSSRTRLDTLTSEQLARRTLWREGVLAFDATTLGEAVSDVQRQSGQHFRFADPELAAVRVTGLIRASDVGAFIELLRENLNIFATRRGTSIVLSRARSGPN